MHCLKCIGKYVYAVHIVTVLQAEQSGVQFLAGTKIVYADHVVTVLQTVQAGVQFLAGGRDFPLLQNVQTGFGTHSAPY